VTLRQRLEGLRGLLARGFRGEPVPHGDVFRAGRALATALGDDDEQSQALAAWLAEVAFLDQLEDDDRQVLLARGLRLCRQIGGAPVAAPPPPRGDSPLDAALESLPGIGPASAERLRDRGIGCVGDLLFLLPRRYDDARIAVPLAEMGEPPSDRVVVVCEVASVSYVRRSRSKRWLDVRLAGGDRALVVRFFGAFPSLRDKFPVGAEVALAGAVSARGGQLEMTNPDLLDRSRPQILVRYPAVPGVGAAALRKACAAAALRAAATVADAVPAAIRRQLELPDRAEALLALHQPPVDLEPAAVAALNRGASPWHRRLAFEELFVLAAAVARRRADRRAADAPRCPPGPAVTARLIEALPFAPTAAQRRATGEIGRDLAGPRPMNRLLQGDVGSGKTAVAFAAALQVAAAGRQVALMAPTAILAEQHAAALAPWCRAAGLRSTLLTAQIPSAARRSRLALLGAGEIDLAIGTHALIAEGVAFAELGLAIVDEQHRFGVAQRVALRRKGGAPHLLVMTATPIPRSLALSIYGDLDVSVIDELPPGRSAAQTHVLRGASGRGATYRALRKRLDGGEQAFVVCPLIEPPEDPDAGRDWRSATAVWAELREALAPHSIGLVHGRLAADERGAAMERFRRGEDRVLVATTVIEVGVDVPAATVMVVEDADHFGLAQLHQLRGRVGRGGGESHCALLTRGRSTDEARRRLEVMEATGDGFRIAEEDLSIRGPGEMFGSRQAGLPALRFGDLREHLDLLARARELAGELLATDPELALPEHQALARALAAAASEAEPFDAESG
jgi:ATP-dependent DNA helicase RecG